VVTPHEIVGYEGYVGCEGYGDYFGSEGCEDCEG